MLLENRPCPVCSSPEHEVLFLARSRAGECSPPIESKYVKCKQCGLIYLNPLPDFSELNVLYNEMPVQQEETYIEKLLSRLEYLLSPLLDKVEYYHTMPHTRGGGRKLLDIGCGDGRKLVRFRDNGWEIYGVDISKKAIEVAQRRVPDGYFYCGTLKAAAFPDDYFDCIRLDNVLGHIPDPVDMLAEIRRILRPGGELFIYVPSGEGFTLGWLPRYSVSSWVPFHLNLFTRRAMLTILRQAGFAGIVNFAGCTPITWLYGCLKLFFANRSLTSGMSAAEKVIAGLMLTPISWMLNFVGLAEELVICVKK